MNTVGSPDVFEGNASETVATKFRTLKPKFAEFVELVNTFADQLTGAAETTEHAEQTLASGAEQLF